ncbi:MAG: sugar phosphate isomerase/epimerase [Actinomycetota bacterium]
MIKKSIQLAICTHLIPSNTRASDIAVACGATGIDFAVNIANVDNLKQALNDCCGPDSGFDIRFHAYFADVEIGSADVGRAAKGLDFMRHVVANVAAAEGHYLTIHLGFNLGLHGVIDVASTIDGLKALVDYAGDLGVTVCVENLRRGLTARPEDFIRVAEETGAAVTFDVGHFNSSEAAANGWTAEDIIAKLGNRIAAAHVYEAEVDGKGHIAPLDLTLVRPALDALSKTTCGWWVAELGDPDEISRTINLLRDYRRQPVS